MAKTAAVLYECAECGWRTSKWAGRCGDCAAWGTVAEALPAAEVLPRPGARAQLKAVAPVSAALPIGLVDAAAARARPTGMDELDRVLGGGLVPGAVVLLAGEPGVGKSTLLLEAGALAAAHGRVLYVTGEESAAQVRLRADRIGAMSDPCSSPRRRISARCSGTCRRWSRACSSWTRCRRSARPESTACPAG